MATVPGSPASQLPGSPTFGRPSNRTPSLADVNVLVQQAWPQIQARAAQLRQQNPGAYGRFGTGSQAERQAIKEIVGFDLGTGDTYGVDLEHHQVTSQASALERFGTGWLTFSAATGVGLAVSGAGSAGAASGGSGAAGGGTAAGATAAAHSGFGVLDGVYLALAGLGTALDVIGKLKAGDAAKAAGDAAMEAAKKAAEIDNFNGQVADQQAADAMLRGQIEEQKYRAQIRATIGSQRAGFASQNVDVSQGSPQDVQADAAYVGELDAQTIHANATREAWGYSVDATNARHRAELDLLQGKASQAAGNNQQAASRIGAAESVINTGASLLATRYRFGRNG